MTFALPQSKPYSQFIPLNIDRSPLINWAAYELKVSFEMAPDLSSNPHPFRQIPCLVDNVDGEDAVVFESGAILTHLLSKKAEEFTVKERAEMTSWIVWANASLDPVCFLETPEGKV